jgi:hypothetical protein
LNKKKPNKYWPTPERKSQVFVIKYFFSFLFQYQLSLFLQERGKNDLIELFEKVKKELEARKRENDELREMIETENDKRMREAEAIKKRLEKEKQELRDFLAEDKEKLTNELLAANQVRMKAHERG